MIMAVKTIGQSTHPQLKKIIQEFTKDFFGYVPKPKVQQFLPKNPLAKRYRVPRKFNFEKPNRCPIMFPVFIFFIVVLVISWVMHYYLHKEIHGDGFSSSTAFSSDSVLIITAHPDDESMFFAPTITKLVDNGNMVHLLCLTTGNYYGQGEERKNELYSGARLLGLKHDNIQILDHKDIKDSDEPWDIDTATVLIEHFVSTHKIQLVLTFDDYGVSGHINHRSVYYAVRNLLSKPSLKLDLVAYKLESTNVIRKYCWLLDLPYSWWSNDRGLMFIADWSDVSKAQEAMRAHRSQYVWFRKIYIHLSRYMIMNTFKPITAKEHGKRTKTL